jgi:hypothetical protein
VRWARPVDAPRPLQHDGVVLRHLVVRPAHGGRCRPAATGRGAELPVSRTVCCADDASRRTAEGDDGRTVVCLPTDLPATQSAGRATPTFARRAAAVCRVQLVSRRAPRVQASWTIGRTGSTPSRARSAVHLGTGCAVALPRQLPARSRGEHAPVPPAAACPRRQAPPARCRSGRAAERRSAVYRGESVEPAASMPAASSWALRPTGGAAARAG